MSQSEDMEAIHRYIVNSPLNTKQAERLHDDWLGWYEGLTWWEKSMDTDTYDKARNRRNEFNRANAVTVAAKQAADEVKTRGLTTEELAGGYDRRLASGEYAENFVSSKVKVAVAATLGGVGVLWALKKVYLPWL